MYAVVCSIICKFCYSCLSVLDVLKGIGEEYFSCISMWFESDLLLNIAVDGEVDESGHWMKDEVVEHKTALKISPVLLSLYNTYDHCHYA